MPRSRVLSNRNLKLEASKPRKALSTSFFYKQGPGKNSIKAHDAPASLPQGHKPLQSSHVLESYVGQLAHRTEEEGKAAHAAMALTRKGLSVESGGNPEQGKVCVSVYCSHVRGHVKDPMPQSHGSDQASPVMLREITSLRAEGKCRYCVQNMCTVTFYPRMFTS